MNIPKTYLTEAIDDKSILRILTQDKQINKADPKYNYYKQLADWANHRQLKTKNVDLNTIKLSDRSLIGKQLNNRYNSLGSLLDTLKNLMDQQGKYDPNSALSNLIQKTTLDILVSLKEEPKVEKPEETEQSNLHEGIDWTAEKAKRLTDARESGEAISDVLNKFYDDYYSIEYAGGTNGDASIIAKLKSLDKILIPEFNKLGYNPNVNPFAQFLKLLIKHKRSIFDKLTINNYGAIHNSFIEKNVTGNMLGNYNEGNILFCDDLYSKNGLDIIEYLSLQNQALKNAEGNDKYSNIKNKLIAVLFIQQKPVSDSYEENIQKLLESDNIAPPAANEAKVKSLLEVQELYRHLFKSTPKKTPKVDEIVNRAIAQKVVLNMVQRLIDQDDLERTYKDVVQAIKVWLNELGYKRNDAAIEKAKEILSDYRLDTSTARSLVIALQNHYNKNVRDKKAESKS